MIKKIITYIITFAVIVWAFYGLKIDIGGIDEVFDFLKISFPPDFSILPRLIKPLLQTFQIAISAVLVSSIIALLLSPFASYRLNNIKLIYRVVKILFSILRGIPPLLYALIFVVIVGLGPFAGMLALTFHCIGTLGRFISEAIETMNKNIIEAMKIDGANKVTIYFRGVIPSLGEYIIGYILYYFEYCVRTSTALGLVGAGGLGFALISNIRLFKYDKAIVVFGLILLIIVIMDIVSQYIRKRFIEDKF